MNTTLDADLMALSVNIVALRSINRPKCLRIIFGLLVTLRHGDEGQVQAAWKWMQECATAMQWGKNIPPFPDFEAIEP